MLVPFPPYSHISSYSENPIRAIPKRCLKKWRTLGNFCRKYPSKTSRCPTFWHLSTVQSISSSFIFWVKTLTLQRFRGSQPGNLLGMYQGTWDWNVSKNYRTVEKNRQFFYDSYFPLPITSKCRTQRPSTSASPCAGTAPDAWDKGRQGRQGMQHWGNGSKW